MYNESIINRNLILNYQRLTYFRRTDEMLEKPKETICLLLYNQKMNVGEISEKMYQYRNPKVSVWIGELEGEKWIQQTTPLFENGRKKDRREKYYQATPKCLLDTLKKDVNLTSHDEEKLLSILSSSDFKFLIGKFIDINPRTDFRSIKNILSYFAIYIRIFTKYATQKTGMKTKDFRRMWDKAQHSGANKELFFATFNRYYMELSEQSHPEPDYSFEEMLFGFITLGDDLLLKLCSLNESYDVMFRLAFTVLAMRDTIDKLPRVT